MDSEPLIYCLTIRTNNERFNFMAEQLKAFNVQFVDAVVPSEYPDNYAAKKRLRHYGRPMTLGEVGCYLSHRKIWQLFLNSDREYAVVLEDDMELTADFLESVVKSTSLKTRADLIRLHGIYKRKLNKLEGFQIGQTDYWLCDVYKQPAGTGAYIIFREAAMRLLETTQEIYAAIDDAIDREWENKLKIYMVWPNTAKTSRRFPSTICRQRPPIGSIQKLIRIFCRTRQAVLKSTYLLAKKLRGHYE